MGRKKTVAKRDVIPDPKFNDIVISKFINCMMEDGKKAVAESALYATLDIIQKKTNEDPLKIFKKALENLKPVLEVKSRRVGGATYQVPIEVKPARRTSLASRWLIDYARDRAEKSIEEKLAAEIARVSDVLAGKHGFEEARDTEKASIMDALSKLTGQKVDWNMAEKLLMAQRIQAVETFFTEAQSQIGENAARLETLQTVKSRTYMRWLYGYQIGHEVNMSDRVDFQIKGRVGRQDNAGTSEPYFVLRKSEIKTKRERAKDKEAGLETTYSSADPKGYSRDVIDIAQKGIRQSGQDHSLTAKERKANEKAFAAFLKTREAWLKAKAKGDIKEVEKLSGQLRQMLTGGTGSAQYNLDINDMKQRVRKNDVSNPWFMEWRRISSVASELESPENENNAANIASEVVEAIFKAKDIKAVEALIQGIFGVGEIQGLTESRREALKARILEMIASGQIKITEEAFKQAVDEVKMDFVDAAQNLERNPKTYVDELTNLGKTTEENLRNSIIKAMISKNTPAVEKGSISVEGRIRAQERWKQSYEQGRIEAFAKEQGVTKVDSKFEQMAKRTIRGVKSLYEGVMEWAGRAPVLEEVHKSMSRETSTKLIEESQKVNSGVGAIVEVRKTQELISRQKAAPKVTIDLGELTQAEIAKEAARPEGEVKALDALKTYGETASKTARTQKAIEMTIGAKSQNIVMNLGGPAAKGLEKAENREALLKAITSGQNFIELDGRTIIIAKNTGLVDGKQSEEIHIMDEANLDLRTLKKEAAAAKKVGLDVKYSFTDKGVNVLIGTNEIAKEVWIQGSGNILVNAKIQSGMIGDRNIVKNTTAKNALLHNDAVSENVVAETLDLAKGAKAKDIAASTIVLEENAQGELLGSVTTKEVRLANSDIRRGFYKGGFLSSRFANANEIKEQLANNPPQITIMEEKPAGQPGKVKVMARMAIQWLKGNRALSWMVPKTKAEKAAELSKKDKELETKMRESITKAVQLPYELWAPEASGTVLESIKGTITPEELKAYQESLNPAYEMAQDAESILNSTDAKEAEIAKAKVIVAASLRIDPKESTANRLKGDLLIKEAAQADAKEAKALKEQALAHYEASYAIDSRDRQASEGLIKTALELGQNTIALDAAKAGAKEFGDRASKLLLGRTLIKTGSEAEGIKLVAKAERIGSGTVKKYTASVETSKQIQAKEKEKQQTMMQMMMARGKSQEEQQAAMSEIQEKQKALDEEIAVLKNTLTQANLTIAETIHLAQATETSIAPKFVPAVKDETLKTLSGYMSQYSALKNIPVSILNTEEIQKDGSALNILKVLSKHAQKAAQSTQDKAKAGELIKAVQDLESSYSQIQGTAAKLEELLKASEAQVGIIQMVEAISQAAQAVNMINGMPEKNRSILRQMIMDKGSKIGNQDLWTKWLSSADEANFAVLMKDMVELPGFAKYSAVLDIPEHRQILNSLVPQLAAASSNRTASEVTDESLSATST